MPNVVIIHAADDTLPARALSEKLRLTQAQVTLEHTPGQKLRLAIDAADVVVALWSPRAIEQAALVDDVSYARDAGKILHASMQSAALPEPFGGDPSVNLTGWRGEDSFAPWRQLASLVVARIGAPPLAPPAPRPSSGLFNPASAPASPSSGNRPETPTPVRPEPPPFTEPPPLNVAMSGFDRPEPGSGRTLIYCVLATVAVGVAGAGGFMLLGPRGDGAQATSLEDVDIGDASALREFIAGAASRAEREQAEDALDTLEQQSLDAARDENTIEAFEAFLRDFPESEEAVFAQGQIQQIRLRQADQAAATALAPPVEPPPTTTTTIEAPVAATTEPVPLNVPPPQPGQGGPADLSPPPTEAETPPG